jgi:nitroreductase
MTNPVLEAIRERRNNLRFSSTKISEEKLNLVLEAGRWAPSWANSQPWRFIVVKDKDTMEKMSNSVSTFFNLAIKDAPVCIAVCVNSKKDAFHYIEDGTIATQNMALAAYSLGLGTSWVGVFSLFDEKNSSERKIKKLLEIPKDWRLISILPLGIPKFKETSHRKKLSDLVDLNVFEPRVEDEKPPETKQQSQTPVQKLREPSSARELEPALV